MAHTLTIGLEGRVCDHCLEPLDEVAVRLHRTEVDEQVVRAVGARTRTTAAVLAEDEVEAMADRQLAEEVTDHAGRVTFELGEDYGGGPVEVVVVLGPQEAPLHVAITTLQPRWRQTEAGPRAVWEHVLSSRLWCAIKEAVGDWSICGCVYVCPEEGERIPVPGVVVTAIDRDWLQDDPLGTAVTGTDGCFRIDYTPDDFTPGTFVDVENPFWPWAPPSRPDVYFRVETGAGTPLLAEDPSIARTPPREDVGACLCVELCLEDTPPDVPEYLSNFTRIGGYEYAAQVDSAPGGTGLTVADDRAFHRTIRLNGLLSKTLGGSPTEYRFEVRELPSGAWNPVTPAQVANTRIGTWQRVTTSGSPPTLTIDEKAVVVKGTDDANTIGVDVAPDGWIEVPQMTGAFDPDGHFEPNGNLLRLDTRTLASWGDLDMSAQVAGDPSVQPLAQNRQFGIRMVVRQQGAAPGTTQAAGVCETLAVENTSYSNINRHPDWMPQHLDDQLGVCMVDISQLVGDGCSEITTALDVRFTAIHPNLGTVGLRMTGPGGPYTSWSMPAASTGQHAGTATPNIVVADLEPCAYIVELTVPLQLTTGDSHPDPLQDQIAFCKG